MGLSRVLLGLVALSMQPRVFAQSAPFQNVTAPTETSSLGVQTTENAVTADAGSSYSTSTAGQADSAAFKAGGPVADNQCPTKTVTDVCTETVTEECTETIIEHCTETIIEHYTVTETVCGDNCPGQGKTTYVSKKP